MQGSGGFLLADERNLSLVVKSKLRFKFSLGSYLQWLETLGTKALGKNGHNEHMKAKILKSSPG